MASGLSQNICEFLQYCFEYIRASIHQENEIMTAVIKSK